MARRNLPASLLRASHAHSHPSFAFFPKDFQTKGRVIAICGGHLYQQCLAAPVQSKSLRLWDVPWPWTWLLARLSSQTYLSPFVLLPGHDQENHFFCEYERDCLLTYNDSTSSKRLWCTPHSLLLPDTDLLKFQPPVITLSIGQDVLIADLFFFPNYFFFQFNNHITITEYIRSKTYNFQHNIIFNRLSLCWILSL